MILACRFFYTMADFGKMMAAFSSVHLPPFQNILQSVLLLTRMGTKLKKYFLSIQLLFLFD
jgi:hypothetical protein